QLRLVHALRLLAAGAKVSAVALDVGYDSPSAFIAAFRRILGETPARDFRARAGGGARAADRRNARRLPTHDVPVRAVARGRARAAVGAGASRQRSSDLDVLPEADPVVDLLHPRARHLVRPRGALAVRGTLHDVVELDAVWARVIARGLRRGAEQL